MTPSELLDEAFGSIPSLAAAAVDGLDDDALRRRPDPAFNPVGWLVWHVGRVQDDHVAKAVDVEQVWTRDGFVDSFGLALDPGDIGYGHDDEQVAAVRGVSARLLTDYVEAVVGRTREVLGETAAADFDRVVDRSWTPPVTLGVRLVSVLGDNLQHLGQAAYVRSLVSGD